MKADHSLSELLQKRLKRLTAREEQLASNMSNNMELWAFANAKSIAEQAKVHRSTIIRFAQKIGFKGFPEFQEAVRKEFLKTHTTAPELSLGFDKSGNDAVTSVVQSVYGKDLNNLKMTYQNLDFEDLDKTAAGLAKAKRVLIFGRRFSYPIALHIGYFLRVMRDGVSIAPDPGGSSVDSLFSMSDSDYALIVTLVRYSPEVQRVLDYLQQVQTPLTIMTDAGNLPRGAEHASLLRAHVKSSSILGSYSAMMSMSHALLNCVGTFLTDVDSRFENIEKANALFNKSKS